MLGDILYQETGSTIGMRVVSVDASGITVEVTLQTQGEIRGVGQTSLWTYQSTTRPDGSIHGGGKGFMATAEGDILRLEGVGSAKGTGADGSVAYRGTVHISTDSERFADLNGGVGVFEYDVGADGNTSATCWDWT